MQSTGFAGSTFTVEEEPLSAARPEMAESFALVDDGNLADRVLAPEFPKKRRLPGAGRRTRGSHPYSSPQPSLVGAAHRTSFEARSAPSSYPTADTDLRRQVLGLGTAGSDPRLRRLPDRVFPLAGALAEGSGTTARSRLLLAPRCETAAILFVSISEESAAVP